MTAASNRRPAGGTPPASQRIAYPQGVRLRPLREDDREFLRALYASTRREELAVVPWSETQKSAFLAMQFDAQDAHYRQHYPDGDFQIIERDGARAGRLYLDTGDEEIRIVDIALLPEHRNAGIGGRLLREILQLAAAQGRIVRIHVERQNPALSLYRRLGFRPVDERGVYYLMEWCPGDGQG